MDSVWKQGQPTWQQPIILVYCYFLFITCENWLVVRLFSDWRISTRGWVPLAYTENCRHVVTV